MNGDGGGSAALHVVATAGHVDHGKSSLIVRLTGMDPDRLEEEKRRGLTIDLGFAWTVLPSGREIGFVDVPGHERFIRNMLAGVGPVRLVLFVIAADEGWKPQSEEHLQILDVLGTAGGVVAVTKADLVDVKELAERVEDVRARLAGTALQDAEVVPCSARTGDGVEELRAELDAMIDAAPRTETSQRPRHFIDRVFTIRGAGTVVTGTLTGGPLRVGQEAQLLPDGVRARIRGLQSHKRTLEEAVPVSRVAVNLAATAKETLGRGDVLALPGQWRPTAVVEGVVRGVRGLDHPVTQRGAYKLYAGSAERDARIRILDRERLEPHDEAFVRISLDRPVVFDIGDRFVLRDAGRRATVAGGVVLDLEPPRRVTHGNVIRLGARRGASREELSRLLVDERGAIRADDVLPLTGWSRPVATRLGAWIVSATIAAEVHETLRHALEAFHHDHPLLEGMPLAEARAVVAAAVSSATRERQPADPGLVEELLAAFAHERAVRRDATTVSLPSHDRSTAANPEARRLLEAVAAAEPSPPTVEELAAIGFTRDLVAAVCADGRLVRVSQDIVVTPAMLARAEELVRELAPRGELTVSAFRQRLGTSRRFALPILELLDTRGVTRRQGDVRVLRG